MVAIRKPAVDPRLFRSARSGVGQARSRHPIAAWFGLLALRGVALLPFPVIYRLAGILGRVAGGLPVRTSPRRRRPSSVSATRGRTRFGARLAPATPGGLRTLVRDLSDGGIVGIMPDQDPRRGAGVFVPFFGVLANTTTLISRLAGLSGARVVLAFAERLPAGAGFCLHFREASPAVYDADMLTSAAALNLDIERLVRDCPEQYLWSYKRFRVRPHGEQNPYRPLARAETTTH